MEASTSQRRRAAVGVACMVAGAFGLVSAVPAMAGNAGIAQTTPSSSVVEGNKTCGDFGFDFEFKIEFGEGDPVAGTFTDPDSGLVVTISNVTTVGGQLQFDFTTSFPIDALFVKAGPGGILYTFDPPTTSGTGIVSPKDSVSHISVCWNEVTTTTSSSSTSTSSTSTTSTSTSSTSTTSTSSTIPGETTTTVVSMTSLPPTTAPGVATTVVSGRALPRTGSTTTPLLVGSAALLAGGAGLVAGTRRFRRG
jgi:LPXTG-motif cell wall-anchored protein